MEQKNSSSLRSMSDMSDPDMAYISNDIPFSVRRASSTSDSDIDSPRSDYLDKELTKTNSQKVYKIDHKTSNKTIPYEVGATTLCPIVPFLGNQPTKIRPLGEEFRIRRISRNSQSSAPNKDIPYCDLNSTDNSEVFKSPSPSINKDSQGSGNVSKVRHLNPESKFANKNLNSKSIFKNGNESDCDYDVPDASMNSHKKSGDNSIKKHHGLNDSSNINQIRIPDRTPTNDNSVLDPSSSMESLSVDQSVSIPPLVNYNSEFQDFLLEQSNFQFESPMEAESVELDDRTMSDNENGDYDDDSDNNGDELDCDIKPTMMDTIGDKASPINAISFEMICPPSKEVISVDSGFHILEDGHFFYEKIGDVDSETESELESQNILSNNDIIKTYKRPGSTVHFNLNKVRVYSTYVPGEYNRKNEEIDPLSSAAEYEMEKRLEKMEIFPVDLFKGHCGLGISILGMGVGHSAGMQKLGIFVKSITEGGAAEMDGRIQTYDQIVEVNGQSLVSVSQEFAASVLRNTNGVVNFLIGRETDQTNSEIVRLVEKSRQSSRLVSESDTLLPSPTSITEYNTINTKNNSEQILQEGIQNESNRFEDDDIQENMSSHAISSANAQVEVTEGNVDALRCIINDLNHQLDDYRLNKEKMSITISQLKNEIEQNNRLKSDLESLSTKYAIIQSDLKEKLYIIDDLSVENSSLKEKLEKTTKKYKEIKRILKISEIKNEHQNGNDHQPNKSLAFYDNKVKILEDKVKYLEQQLRNKKDNSKSISSPSDKTSHSNIDQEMKHREGQQSVLKKSSVTESVNSQRQDSDKVLINLKINLTNNHNESIENTFSDIANKEKMLDNGPAKNKAELRKSSQMANRKPPTKSMMIGDKSNDVIDSSFMKNSYNSVTDVPAAVTNVTSTKTNASKMFGGFALPGKNEIRLGMKPSDNVESKKNDNRLKATKSTDPSGKYQSIDDATSLNNHSTKNNNSPLLPTETLYGDSHLLKATENNSRRLQNTSTKSDSTTVTTIDSNGNYKTKL